MEFKANNIVRWVCLQKRGSGEHLSQENKRNYFREPDFPSVLFKLVRGGHRRAASVLTKSISMGQIHKNRANS